MPELVTRPNLPDPDAFYARLTETHRDLSDADSALLNCKLILLLCNHIGDIDVIEQALAAAREGLAPSEAGMEAWRPIRT